MLELLMQSKKAVKCWSCGSIHFTINHYEHDGGWETPSGRKWFYLTCSDCGYQTSFDKLGISRNATSTPNFNTVIKKIHPDVCKHPDATYLTQIAIQYKNQLGLFFKKFRKELLLILTN